MYQNLQTKNIKARKQHKCDWCGRDIEKGEEYERQKYICDGNFFEWHSHLSCSRVATEIWEYCDPDEGMSEDEFMDGCNEVCRKFICPDCENWNDEFEDCEMDEPYCIDKMDKFFETHELYEDRELRRYSYKAFKCREKDWKRGE